MDPNVFYSAILNWKYSKFDSKVIQKRWKRNEVMWHRLLSVQQLHERHWRPPSAGFRGHANIMSTVVQYAVMWTHEDCIRAIKNEYELSKKRSLSSRIEAKEWLNVGLGFIYFVGQFGQEAHISYKILKLCYQGWADLYAFQLGVEKISKHQSVDTAYGLLKF